MEVGSQGVNLEKHLRQAQESDNEQGVAFQHAVKVPGDQSREEVPADEEHQKQGGNVAGEEALPHAAVDVFQAQSLVGFQRDGGGVLRGINLHLGAVGDLFPPGGGAELLQGLLPLRGARLEPGGSGVVGDGIAEARGLGPAVLPEGDSRLFQPPALGGHDGEVFLHAPVVIELKRVPAIGHIFHFRSSSPAQVL